MVDALWFVDPTSDAARPLRQLFQTSHDHMTFDELWDACQSRFPCVRSDLFEIMLHTDPMITVKGSDFHYNWPGTAKAEEILNVVLDGLENGDLIDTVWNRQCDALMSMGLKDVFEFCSFLHFDERIAPDGSFDVATTQSVLEAMVPESDFIDSALSLIIDYLGSTGNYSSFEEIKEHCQIDDTEVESVISLIESSSSIIKIGDYYKLDSKRNAESIITFRWPSDTKLFVPDFYKENETTLEKLGYRSDFELIRDLERLFPESMSPVSIFDTKEILEVHDNRLRGAIESRSRHWTNRIVTPDSNRLHQLVYDHTGSSFHIKDAIAETNMSSHELMNSLYSFGNVSVDFNRAFVYDVDEQGLFDILKDCSDGKRHQVIDILKNILNNRDLSELNIVSVNGLISLILSYFPEVFNPLTEEIDTAPFHDSVKSDSSPVADDSAVADQIRVYNAIRDTGQGSRFKIRRLFPDLSDDRINAAIDFLVSSRCVLCGPFGLECSPEKAPSCPPPAEVGLRVASKKCTDGRRRYVHRSPESRLRSLESFEGLMLDVIGSSVGYNPSSRIPETIKGIKGRRVSETVHRLLYGNCDAHAVLSKLKDAEANEVLNVLEEMILDEDKELFCTYDIPSNLFMFLFNRSREYYRALSIAFERGTGSPQNMLSQIMTDGLMIHRSESSEGLMNVRDRYLAMFDALNSRDWLITKSDEVDAVMFTLFMFNEYSLYRYELIDLCHDLIGRNNTVDSVGDVNIWSTLPDFVHVERDSAELFSFNVAMSINGYLIASTCEYAHGLEKFQKQNRLELMDLGMYGDSLPWFIQNLGLVRSEDGFILGRNSLHDSIARFAENKQLYDQAQILDKYSRKFGGRKEVLEPAIADVCADRCDRVELDEEMVWILDSELEEYDWITEVNARSLIEDKCGYRDAFSISLMHNLGFKFQGDLFYRTEYKNFSECLKANEFFGDDCYVDNGLRVKMESTEFTKTVQALAHNLMWIRVSSSRYINLRSEKFAYLLDALRKYKKMARELCTDCFMTPYSFSKIPSGMEEIDDDDFGLEFYEDVLVASGSRRTSIEGSHVFFYPDKSGYECTAPDFIKYVIANIHGGSATISEVQDTLETKYGLKSSLTFIRYCAKKSCIVSKENDMAYSSDERYLEDFRDERQ